MQQFINAASMTLLSGLMSPHSGPVGTSRSVSGAGHHIVYYGADCCMDLLWLGPGAIGKEPVAKSCPDFVGR